MTGCASCAGQLHPRVLFAKAFQLQQGCNKDAAAPTSLAEAQSGAGICCIITTHAVSSEA
jgi:hypothetical protein